MREGKCPFLEVTTVTYCKAFPVKMIPVERISRSKGLCSTVNFEECSLYKEINSPDTGLENVRGFLLRSDCHYHPRHLWVRLSRENENEAMIGIDDFARRLIGKVNRISVAAEGTGVKENHVCFLLHGSKGTARLAAPVDGVIRAVNPKIASDPSLVDHDPYHEGWLVTMQLAGEGAKGLFYGRNARKWLECEIERLHRAFSDDLGITAADGGEAQGDISARLSEAQWSRIVNQFLG